MIRTPQEEGRAYEASFAATWGAKEMPGSGATPRYKLDVGALDVLWSLKWTAAKSYRLTEADILEMLEGAGGPGSRNVLGMMGIRMDGIGQELTVARTGDLLAVLRGDVELTAPPTRRDMLRTGARPALLREGER